MANSLPPNEHITLQTIYAFSVEEQDILSKNVHKLHPLPQKPREELQKSSPKPSLTAHQLRMQKNRKQPFDLCTDFRLHLILTMQLGRFTSTLPLLSNLTLFFFQSPPHSCLLVVFKALIDSSSTHCFVNSHFISKNNLLTYSIPLIQLRLFDGSNNNVITQAIKVPLQFPLNMSLRLDSM